MKISHQSQLQILKKLRALPGIRKVFVASGLRYDLILHDQHFGMRYLNELVQHHVSGQLKIAPEHSSSAVLELMGKPGTDALLDFKQRFDDVNRANQKKQFLTYYFIAAYPGCNFDEMRQLQNFIGQKLKLKPEQVQIFIPAPSTWASIMYYTEMKPGTLKPIFVEKNIKRKQQQKDLLISEPGNKKKGKPWDKRKTRK